MRILGATKIGNRNVCVTATDPRASTHGSVAPLPELYLLNLLLEIKGRSSSSVPAYTVILRLEVFGQMGEIALCSVIRQVCDF